MQARDTWRRTVVLGPFILTLALASLTSFSLDWAWAMVEPQALLKHQLQCRLPGSGRWCHSRCSPRTTCW